MATLSIIFEAITNFKRCHDHDHKLINQKLQTIIDNQEKLMSIADDIKIEFESWLSDVKVKFDAQNAAIDALTKHANENEDAKLTALLDEMKAAHSELASSILNSPLSLAKDSPSQTTADPHTGTGNSSTGDSSSGG